MLQQQSPNLQNSRSQAGFTLTFAVVLCVMFASLLYLALYFLKINTKESDSAIYTEQVLYLAESGNNRAMARFNVKTLPEIDLDQLPKLDLEDEEAMEEGEEDEDFFDEFEEELSEEFDEDDRIFLAQVPRYVNFYLKHPLYVNIDTGQIIDEPSYFSLISQQQSRIQANKQESQKNGRNPDEVEEILIEELYFPLPEVNVQKIGSFPISKGTHIKPGFKITLAERVPVSYKQKNILEEYFNFVPATPANSLTPKVNNITPNFASPGDYMDIFLEGKNLQEAKPNFSSADIVIVDSKETVVSIAVSEQAKPGRVKLKVGPNAVDFFIIPLRDGLSPPIIKTIQLPQANNGETQFIKMGNKQKIQGIIIKGENLVSEDQPPVIVPDSAKIEIEIVSFKKEEVVINIKTSNATIDSHYFSIFTTGGQSNSWLFNIEKTVDGAFTDPYIGTYSTVATLLEVNSLSNLPYSSIAEGGRGGRPAAASSSGGNTTERPESITSAQTNNKNKGFDLLRSDLELVWKLETVANVNKKIYKETRIIRRNVPRAQAALTTNTEISFAQSSVVIEGKLEALTRLEEYSSSGDATIFVEGENPNKLKLDEDLNRPPAIPNGSAVIESFKFGAPSQSPSAKGFREGGIVSVISANRRDSYVDYGFIKSLGEASITLHDPGLKTSHFVNDEVIQYIPAIISPESISERDAQRNLDPPGAIANIPGILSFEYVFRTTLEDLINWHGAVTENTSIPDDNELYEGYFGLNIISGTPTYSGRNSLYGQGTLIIDTTKGGRNPQGGTVTIGGSSNIPTIFEGVIYIIGNLKITGNVELSGAIFVNSPTEGSTTKISGSGNISYNTGSLTKSIIHLPFSEEPQTRIVQKSKGELEILGK